MHGLREIRPVVSDGSRLQLVCACGEWRSNAYWKHSKKAYLANVQVLRQHVISTWKTE